MSGGAFNAENKIRPGAYLNFKSNNIPVGTISDRGTVAIPIPLNFGPPKTVISLFADTDILSVFGFDIEHDDLMLVREAFKRANRVLVFRLNSGQKAAATIGDLSVSALYPGGYGNNIKVSVEQHNDDSHTIKTFINNEEVDSQTVNNMQNLAPNNFVEFTGAGDFTETPGTNLENGASHKETISDYNEFFKAISTYDFNCLALPVLDSDIRNAGIQFVKKMRENEGKKLQIVVAGAADPDYEGVINVANGVILENQKTITKEQATAWVAAATAGAFINESLTYSKYDGAIAAHPRLLHSEIIEKLQGGEFVFESLGETAIVEQDINSFTSVSPIKAKHFSKNRFVRTIDSIGNDIKSIFEGSYIGKINNNDVGRSLFKSECIEYLKSLQEISAIDEFNPSKDIRVLRGKESESVIVNLTIQPVDSIEKLYMTVNLC